VGHTPSDAIIVTAICAALFGYLYLRYRSKKDRLEIIHQERILAMDKQIPLPELPFDPPPKYNPYSECVPLILGLMLSGFGFGTMVALFFFLRDNVELARYWVMPLPIALMGLGLILVHFLVSNHKR